MVKKGDSGAPRPETLAIKVAYGVRYGNPFTKYRSADFRLGQAGVDIEAKHCRVVERGDNWIVVGIQGDDFELAVTGFDTTHRDLHIDVKVRNSFEVSNAAAA